MKTLKYIYPPYLLILLIFVQIISAFINYKIYEFREILIYLCWIPIFTLPYLITQKKLFYKIATTIFFIDGLVNMCHLLILKGHVTASSLFVLSNTNIGEAKEFMQLKFSFYFFLIIPYVFLFILALKQNVPKIKIKINKWIVILVIIFSTTFIFENSIHNRLIRKGIPQTAKALISFAIEMKTFRQLKQRKVINVSAKLNDKSLFPRIFVLIIGESCNRNHLSLYNYHRQTSNKLQIRNDIVVYNNVVSAYSNTLNSILSAFTNSNLENKISYDKSISLIDVFHSTGFKTFWISNQSPIGVWDNAVYNIAQTSDVSIFLNNNANTSFESTYISSYDEQLLSPFQKILNDTAKNKFIVIHLMGSHSTYSKRYPKEFNKYKYYTNKKEKIINEYDNSIIYSDFIVDSLLKIFATYCNKNNNYICSAIYLSDHGENVFDYNDNVGHDYSGSLPKSNVEIPFIVWLSDGYKKFYPNKKYTILNNKDYPFVLDDLFHAIIDINDLDCSCFEKERSIFNENFNKKRTRVLEDNEDYDLK